MLFWEKYIAFETKMEDFANVCNIYHRMIASPHDQIEKTFERFFCCVKLSYGSYLKLLREKPVAEIVAQDEQSLLYGGSDGEAIRTKVIQAREKLFAASRDDAAKRKPFEDKLIRNYFHIKPLPKDQYDAWNRYLDFEIAAGNRIRVVALFERCLVPCAHYAEMWLRYAAYCETQSSEMAVATLWRASSLHCKTRPEIHIAFALLEEAIGQVDYARSLLQNLYTKIGH